MADDGENLVSQVSVTGTEESAAKLNAYANQGAAAFDKLNAAAATGAAGVAAASGKIDAAATTGAASMDKLASSGGRLQELQGALGNLGSALGKLSASFQPLTQAAGKFAARIALTGAGVVAAGAKIASAASGVSKALGSQSSAFDDNTNAQIRANDSALATETSQISLGTSQDALFKQLTSGKITYAQYGQQLQQINDDYDRQQAAAAKVENAQERVRLENERLKKSMEDRKALDALIDKFGGPLVTSLNAFGNQVEGIRKQFLDAFGPGAAALIDLISNTLSKNAVAIQAFFTQAGSALTNLVQNNGPALQKFFENVGSAASSVFNGLIAAAPGVIDFVNNKLAPALAKVASIVQTVTNAFNFVFGTNLTAGGLVVVAIFAQMTGSIRLLFALLKAGKGVLSGFFGVLNAGAGIVDAAFGIKATGTIVKFTTKLAAASGPVRILIVVLQALIPVVTTLATLIATTFGIPFTLAVVVVLALAAALAFLATKVDWKAVGAAIGKFVTDAIAFFKSLLTAGGNAVTSIINAYNGLKEFFSTLGTSISTAVGDIWDGIVALATSAAEGIQAAWNAVGEFFAAIGSAIGDALSAVWDLVVQAAGVAAQGVQTAWTAITEFFAGLFAGIGAVFQAGWAAITGAVQAAVDAVKAVWQVIVDFFKSTIIDPVTQLFADLGTKISTAFQTAIDAIKGFFAGLLADAKAKLQPILDLLNSIAALVSSVTGGGDTNGPAVKAASGGHVHGPGGPTGDKIPAWLSDNEFVIKAKSVAKYGAGMLHAINRGQFRVPKFAMGGLVTPGPRLAYAGGGQVSLPSSMRPLSLTIGGEVFDGLLAPDDVGSRMTKYAISRQNKSAGRKPAWVGRGRN